MARYGMLINTKKCIGCYACRVACQRQNDLLPTEDFIRYEEREIGAYPNVRVETVPLPCMPSTAAPCASAVPTGAAPARAAGTASSRKAGKWSCKGAREGLGQKVGAMAAVLVAAILDGVLGWILDHIPALTLPFDYTVFLTVLVLVWDILTELGSIVENAGRLGAPLPAWLSKAIAALESGVDSTGDKLTQGEKKE